MINEELLDLISEVQQHKSEMDDIEVKSKDKDISSHCKKTAWDGRVRRRKYDI